MMFVCLVFQTVGVVKCWTILSKEVAVSDWISREIQNATGHSSA